MSGHLFMIFDHLIYSYNFFLMLFSQESLLPSLRSANHWKDIKPSPQRRLHPYAPLDALTCPASPPRSTQVKLQTAHQRFSNIAA